MNLLPRTPSKAFETVGLRLIA